ncbi:HRDC domain protein [Mycobacterium xenopi 4042]|uniref:HRDC domain protein n=1 Tax=Mycobacterium xenopi 4042 TaxID=1299334 RepID=X7YKC9_MYCXE|nr:HRDC domain protein [Mycobacterium xenopi 4042]
MLQRLKDWRLRTSKDMNVPAYIVFTDNTLLAIAEMRPTDEAALVAIPGIGARKLEQFGPTCCSWSAPASEPAQRVATEYPGRKIGCRLGLRPFSLEAAYR